MSIYISCVSSTECTDILFALAKELRLAGHRVYYLFDTTYDDLSSKEEQICRRINEICDFLLLLSPRALDDCVNPTDYLRLEIERAIQQKKNIIPIFMHGFKYPDDLPESLSTLPYYEGVYFSEEYFDIFFNKLEEMLVSERTASQVSGNTEKTVANQSYDPLAMSRSSRTEATESEGYAFISYSSKNQASANAMQSLLKESGIKTWMAPGDIPPGSTYPAVISRALKGCSCLILLLSEDAQNSVWVAREVERAISYRKPIIPVQIEDVVLNEAFELYISTDHLVAVQRIEKESEKVQRVIQSVSVYTGQKQSQSNGEEKRTEGKSKKNLLILNDRYRVNLTQTIIGEGLYGLVYPAFDMATKTEVAVKKTESFTPNSIEVQKEISKIRNRNLCNIYDVFVSGDQCFVVMEWFKNGKDLSEDVGGVDIIIDLLKGLKSLHEHGIIHADIQPSNVLTNGYETKLCDFSLAFRKGGVFDYKNAPTFFYPSSPEGRVDERSDLFCVGLVAFSWLCGVNQCIPYMNMDDLESFISEHQDDPYVCVLAKAVKADPNQRYQTAQEFIDALIEEKRVKRI